MEVVAKILMATTIFSKNLISLATTLIGSHDGASETVVDANNKKSKITFYDHLLKIVKIITKDLIEFEKSLKDKQNEY